MQSLIKTAGHESGSATACFVPTASRPPLCRAAVESARKQRSPQPCIALDEQENTIAGADLSVNLTLLPSIPWFQSEAALVQMLRQCRAFADISVRQGNKGDRWRRTLILRSLGHTRDQGFDRHRATTGSAWSDRLRALKNVPPVLHFVWESGPAVVFWNIAIRIVVAFLPVGIGIIGRYIIDGVNRIPLPSAAASTSGTWSRGDGARRRSSAFFRAPLTILTTCSPTAIPTTSALK